MFCFCISPGFRSTQCVCCGAASPSICGYIKEGEKERWLLRLLPSSYIIRLLLFLVCICAADIVRSLSPRKWVAREAAAFIHVVLQLRIYPLAAGPLFPEAFSITTSCRFFFPFSSIRNSNRFRMFPTCPILFPLCSLSATLRK